MGAQYSEQQLRQVRLSEHFSLWEGVRSDTAAREGIFNYPDPQALVYMTRVSWLLLEPLRAILGDKPLTVSSFYRCKALNEAIGGTKESAHGDGRAVDIPPQNGLTVEEILHLITRSPIQYDKAIIEYGRRSRWIHLQVAKIGKAPRRKLLSAHWSEQGQKMVYREV